MQGKERSLRAESPSRSVRAESPSGDSLATGNSTWWSEPKRMKGRAVLFSQRSKGDGLLLTSRLTRKDSGRVTKAIVRMFSKLPSSLSRTITVDNGREFAGHLDWTDQLGIKVYFADPFNSGQRGTNENTNGLLRQYFPKGQTFHAMTNAALKFATNRINNRPRKRLNYQSPLETLHKQSKIAFQI